MLLKGNHSLTFLNFYFLLFLYHSFWKIPLINNVINSNDDDENNNSYMDALNN